jgi:hypothetical protein
VEVNRVARRVCETYSSGWFWPIVPGGAPFRAIFNVFDANEHEFSSKLL